MQHRGRAALPFSTGTLGGSDFDYAASFFLGPDASKQERRGAGVGGRLVEKKPRDTDPFVVGCEMSKGGVDARKADGLQDADARQLRSRRIWWRSASPTQKKKDQSRKSWVD